VTELNSSWLLLYRTEREISQRNATNRT